MTTTDIIRAVLDIIDNAGTTTSTVDAVPNEPGEQTRYNLKYLLR